MGWLTAYNPNIMPENIQSAWHNHPIYFPWLLSKQQENSQLRLHRLPSPQNRKDHGQHFLFESPEAMEGRGRIRIAILGSSFLKGIWSELFGQNLARDSMFIFSRR